jgi:hypothetical protein
MNKLLITYLFCNTAFISLAFSYPQFIGHGYNSCVTCHYNPYGNGPLNDYGRALSAITISDRQFVDDLKSEEEIAKDSNFLYLEELHESIRPSFDYRGLYLDRDVDQNDGNSEFIHMQADLNLVYLIENNFFLSMSYGYAPKPRASQDPNIETYRSREHYIAYRPNESVGIYLGLLDIVYGIRTADHIAFSKQTTGLAQNDQTHGIMTHYTNKNIEVASHVFIGNLTQQEDLRQKGLAIKLESNTVPDFKPGISALKTKSEYFEKTLTSLHFKKGLSKGSSIMLEIGKNSLENLDSKEVTKSTFVFMQNHIFIRRGTYFFLTTEYFKPNDLIENEIVRLGPGIQYFVNRGVELRMDLYNTKNFNPSMATKDTYDFTAQVHLWF